MWPVNPCTGSARAPTSTALPVWKTAPRQGLHRLACRLRHSYDTATAATSTSSSDPPPG
jgi:hypothetical protein